MGRNTTHSTLITRRLAAVGIATVLALSACGGQDDDTSAALDRASAADIAAAEESGDTFSSDDEAEAEAEPDRPATAGNDATGAPIDFTFGRDLVIEASVTMATPDIGAAVDDVIDIARRNGGAVFNADVTVEDPVDDGSVPGGGTIVIRVPPQQLDLLVSDLRGAGVIRNQSQSVDDVTDRLIDLDIQIRQALESVERMEALLAETTEFDALVAAETELAQRQIAYERLLAAKRNVDDRVALSTLTVNLRYQAPDSEPITADPSDPGLGDAFDDGWTAFVSVLFGIAFVVAITAPFLAIIVVLAGVAWLVSRSLRRQRSASINRHEPMDPEPAEHDELIDVD